MGNRFSCSCTPLLRKSYRYDDSPWQTSRRKDGHLLRLWAEVFHVSSGTGTIKWQQVSEDLVPVNITCIQDSPDCVFHITAYNSQVDKILDVRLVQPGTRIGQASECFVYWKDPLTSDTWGLNFTSPIDAKQFKECCSPSFKFSRKASSSYSLKLDPPSKQQKVKVKRKPQSTPASPSRTREPQCTCMTAEQFARLRAQDPRYRSSTLPRAQSRGTETDSGVRSEKVTAATSSSSLYDNVTSGKSQTLRSAGSGENIRSTRDRGIQQQADSGTMTPSGKSTSQNHVASQVSQTQVSDDGDEQIMEKCRSEGTQAGGTLSQMQMLTMHKTPTSKVRDRHHMLTSTRSMDYDMELPRESLYHGLDENNVLSDMLASGQSTVVGRRSKSLSKSTDDMRESQRDLSLDSNTLKRMLKPMTSNESPATSPEMTRRRHTTSSYFNDYAIQSQFREHFPGSRNVMSDAEGTPRGHHRQMMSDRERERRAFSASRSSHEIGRSSHDVGRSSHDIGRLSHDNGRGYPSRDRGLYLELERNAGLLPDSSPPSDNVIFDNQFYATTPSSSNGNSDLEQAVNYRSYQTPSAPVSPTARLLHEYERHLRNTLAKGMDAESYSLHTFEALLSQSMENLELAESLPSSTPRSPYTTRRRSTSNASTRSSTLPLSHRLSLERPSSRTSRDREGYYSDRNELARERDRELGYFSDHNSSNRCASCLDESSHTQWLRLSDGWRSGSSAFGSTSGSMNIAQQSTLSQKRSAWDSLPSLRYENSKEDSGYKSTKADSFEQRSNVFERQDALRSDLFPDRDIKLGIVQQTSVESADSRLCYLTSSEMSDEDRMSLTTAVSDEEDGESLHNSPFKGKQTGAAAASFNCTGAVRKAGFLSVKKWLLRKKHQIELARKRGWKGYWVCLKGTTLLFYPCDSREGRTVEAAPKHLIIVDGAIMQPIPEHPKRDYIFCLSTAFGDAYLFQAPCQVELENWVNSIHCACAAAFARHRGKTGTLHLLQEEIFRLEKTIESQTVLSDQETKQQAHSQILQWEENMERLHCEQFRLRCYMASLHNGELPNPKSLLTHVSRVTKNTLNKLGVFTVSSFHAFICARSPSLLNNLLAGRGAAKKQPPVLSSSDSDGRDMQSNSIEEPQGNIKVTIPDNYITFVLLRDSMTVDEFIIDACEKKNLNPMEHFLRVKKREDMEDQNYFVPHRIDSVETYLQTHEFVEVCPKILYQVELRRTSLEQMWGFSVEADLIDNSDKQDELSCYVSRVEDRSYAMRKGIIKGDEIMVINGAIVSDLDMMYIESVLQEEYALCMMMRSSRTEPPEQAEGDFGAMPGMMRSTEAMIQSLVCPPPPSDPPTMSEEMISGLIVPAPAWSKEVYSPEEQDIAAEESAEGPKATSRTSSFEIENLLKTAEQVTGICRSPQETRKSSPTGSVVSQQSQALFTQVRQLTHAEKLRKVILELVDTEKTYVENLNNLLENYLEPLKKETFLSHSEVESLFGNIQEIVAFQRSFLTNLEDIIEAEPAFNEFDHPNQFKNVLFAIGNSFLYYVNHFKLYSSFCASHSKAQKILHPNEGNQALREFLAARNPKQQHSSTLESYLIKPIQRVLKYPLLLQQLRNLTDPQSSQHQHLVEALKGMEKVAEHINEMQRIHEEYGAIFDHLFRQHQKSCKQVVDLNPVDLLYYGGVEWLNISDFLGKIKKGLELHAMCFVFKSAVVFLCKERLRQKKKIMGVASKSTATEVEIIRYQVLIPVTEVQVRATTSKDVDSHYLWELIHLKSQFHRRSEKSYVLSNSTADFRNAFLKTIRQIIRESVRNMNLPSTKTGQSALNGNLPMPRPPPRDFSISSKGSSSSDEQESTQRPYLQQPQPPVQLQQEQQQHPHQYQLLYSHQQQSSHSRHSSQTLKPRKPKPPQRHTISPVEHDTTDGEEGAVVAFRSRSKTVSDTQEESHMEKTKSDIDSGTKSEGEEDSQSGTISGKKTLGKTPNHLTLSTTSTLSAGSTGSQAKLIQSSHHPESYQPSQIRDLGSPIWKPREAAAFGEATTLPRQKAKSGSSSAEASADRHSTPQGHGTTTRPGRSRKSIADVMMHEK